MDVANWLRTLGLERYEATFRENDVGAELLPNLTSDDLKEIGITSFGHRRQLLAAIATVVWHREYRRAVPPLGVFILLVIVGATAI